VFGDSPPVLDAWARAASDAAASDLMVDALEAWCAAASFDAEPCIRRLSSLSSADASHSIERAVESALEPARLVPASAKPIAAALEALASRGHAASAARLTLRACDALGTHGEPVRGLAARLADNVPADVRRALLERLLPYAPRDGRPLLLRRVVEASSGEAHAETRGLRRLLAEAPLDEFALRRLSQLLAQPSS
jgi:hypothetical protein